MYEVLGQMAALIACGVVWRAVRPLGLDADQTRRALTGLVYVLLLPALVLMVLWQAPLGLDTLRISLVAASAVLVPLGVAWLGYRLVGTRPATAGAMILAASFPNATYLGLPVLEKTLGPWARSVAIQFDLFACTPLLLTVGILVARVHGTTRGAEHPLRALLKVPPLWAALVAWVLNTLAVPVPPWLHGWLSMMAVGVVPLMLISLGMSLRWDCLRWRAVPVVLPVLAIQLLLMPLLAWGVAHWVGLEGRLLAAVVLEAAMPSMVLGLVIADRYGLSTSLYAMAVSISTALSMVSLPLWLGWIDAAGLAAAVTEIGTPIRP